MALDFSPLYRSTIGFDSMTALFDHAIDRDPGGFPPYNIEKAGENTYRIVVALAGWKPDDIELVADGNRLVVRGSPKKIEGEKTYLHRGHTKRAFEHGRKHERRFARGRSQARDPRGAQTPPDRDWVSARGRDLES
jgi:HSP20 family molecular chaperone IbpA